MASDGIGKLVDVAVKIGTTAFGRSRRSNGSLATIALFRGKLFRLTAELVNEKAVIEQPKRLPLQQLCRRSLAGRYRLVAAKCDG